MHYQLQADIGYNRFGQSFSFPDFELIRSTEKPQLQEDLYLGMTGRSRILMKSVGMQRPSEKPLMRE